MEGNSALNSTCVTIPQIDGDVTYCNITQTWQPRVTSHLFMVVPTLLAFVLLIGMLVRQYKVNYWDFCVEQYPFCLANIKGMFKSCKGFIAGVTTIGIYAGLIWDCVDVCLDSKYFLDLENPENGVLDSRIYRNTNILNAIYAFAILGVLKIPLSVWLVTSGTNLEKINWKLLKSFNIALVFIAEDCIENFLEYFYGEKYSIEGQYAVYMVVVDVVITLIFFAQLPMAIYWLREGKSESAWVAWLPFALLLGVIVSGVMRIYGALYQAVTGKLDNGCLQLLDGRLTQTPFTVNNQCMRIFEYLFIVFNFLPLIVGVIMSGIGLMAMMQYLCPARYHYLCGL